MQMVFRLSWYLNWDGEFIGHETYYSNAGETGNEALYERCKLNGDNCCDLIVR